MIVLLISYEQILDFSHVVNCIVYTRLHIKTCYVVENFLKILSFSREVGEGCKLNGNGGVHGNVIC